MKTSISTQDLTPGEFLATLPTGSYVRVSDLPGTPNAAKLAASRAAAKGDIVALAKGLYFKGRLTQYGIATPPPEEIALEVSGRLGVGPAGISATRALGLTTQVPVNTELATIFRPPTGIGGVHFVRRSNTRRLDLNYLEIALLEVLRTWRLTVDGGWDALVSAVRERVSKSDIRLDLVTSAAAREPNTEVRLAALKLADSLSKAHAR